VNNLRCTILVFLISGQAWTQVDTVRTKSKKINLTGIPILSYNSAYGFIVGVNAMAFFDVNKKDTISPASQLGLGGGFSESKSVFGALFAQLYFNEDKWRITAALGLGDINFQYFQTISESGEGEFIDYSTVSRVAYLKVLRKIKGPFYGGIFTKLQYSKTVFELNTDSTATVNSNGLGVSFSFDSRNNVYHPFKGVYATASYFASPQWMGSDSAFNLARGFINCYFKVNNNSTIAARASAYIALGDVPFTGQRAVGGKDIRGYTDGKYRGDRVYTLQTEYRWTFYKRWGAVGFFGVAITENPRSVALPAGGAGIRFMAIPSLNINIGVDGAFGRDDNGIYFRINEAF
jgi:outer membrane protein assembly factor BamA